MGERDELFTALYRKLYRRVLAYLLRRTGPDQAREAADETFLIAWRRLDDLPAAPLPWLLVTARNVLRDQCRHGRHHDALSLEAARLTATRTDPGAGDLAVERISVLSALAQLDEPDRDALMLSVWDGLPNRVAAQIAGCSTATFAVRLHRARRRFAAALAHIDETQSPTGHQRSPAAAPSARSGTAGSFSGEAAVMLDKEGS